MDAAEITRTPVPRDGSGSTASSSTAAALNGRPAKGAPRPVPVRSEDYAHLTLDGLREYRKALTAEESSVSYWRRILQARIDVLREGKSGGLDTQHLRPVLTDARVGSGRTALVQVVDHGDIPPLPSLAELWERRVTPGDTEAEAALDRDLEAAEAQLSAYRAALHRRIGAATTELIARYREQPTLCLTVLPLEPERRAV